jgi:hypothetical protein
MRSTAYKSSAAKAAKVIGAAIQGAEVALSEGRIEQEPAMTDRMLGRIEQALENLEIGGITWKAKTLTDRGRNAQESKFGADFFGVLDVRVPGYYVQKGFLAQAKMIRRWGFLDTRDLVQQCERMLILSPDSFVFLYTEKGVQVTSATAVVAASGNLSAVHKEKAQKFFLSHLLCMIGDRAISSPTPAGLDELVQRANARRGLSITAESSFYL